MAPVCLIQVRTNQNQDMEIASHKSEDMLKTVCSAISQLPMYLHRF